MGYTTKTGNTTQGAGGGNYDGSGSSAYTPAADPSKYSTAAGSTGAPAAGGQYAGTSFQQKTNDTIAVALSSVNAAAAVATTQATNAASSATSAATSATQASTSASAAAASAITAASVILPPTGIPYSNGTGTWGTSFTTLGSSGVLLQTNGTFNGTVQSGNIKDTPIGNFGANRSSGYFNYLDLSGDLTATGGVTLGSTAAGTDNGYIQLFSNGLGTYNYSGTGLHMYLGASEFLAVGSYSTICNTGTYDGTPAIAYANSFRFYNKSSAQLAVTILPVNQGISCSTTPNINWQNQVLELKDQGSFGTQGDTLNIASNAFSNGFGTWGYQSSTNGAAIYNHSNGVHTFKSTTTAGTVGNTISTFADVLKVSKGKTLALEGGTSGTGVGISFPATQVASTDPNTLDDYEEGTWTPGQSGSVTVVGTFSSSGTYTKIGRQVFFTGQIQGSTSVSIGANGSLTTGFPFASAATVCAAVAVNAANTASSVLIVNGASMGTVSAIGATPGIFFSGTYIV
jgi:hypothetical protein